MIPASESWDLCPDLAGSSARTSTREIECQKRNYDPFEEWREPDSHDRDDWHQLGISPAGADDDIQPFAEDRIPDPETDGEQNDAFPTTFGPGSVCADHKRKRKRGERDQYVASGTVHDGEQLLAHRPCIPNCIEGEMKGFPDEIAKANHQEVGAQSAHPVFRHIVPVVGHGDTEVKERAWSVVPVILLDRRVATLRRRSLPSSP